VVSGSVTGLPSAWALPVPPDTPAASLHQALAEAAAGPLGAKQSYSVVIPDAEGGAGRALFPPITIPGGRIAYAPPEGDAPAGVWSISWPEASPAFWMEAASHAKLVSEPNAPGRV
jgi:hypothetical protein